MPVLLTIALGAVLFVAFFLQASGRAALMATLLLISFGIVPVVAVQARRRHGAIAHNLLSAVPTLGFLACLLLLIGLLFGERIARGGSATPYS
jgi:hypothetical protein